MDWIAIIKIGFQKIEQIYEIRAIKWISMLFTAVVFLFFLNAVSPYRFIFVSTNSIAKGIYFSIPIWDIKKLRINDYACFKAPRQDWFKDRNYLHKNLTEICKQIKLIGPGEYSIEKNNSDTTRAKAEWTMVANGVSYPILKNDSKGRPLKNPEKAQELTLADGEFLMMGVVYNSFDSRYYGAISAMALTRQAFPLFTWN